MSTVSLVIPCYRDAATLGRALSSVRAQTRPVDEVLVVDDCSPESAAIAAVLADFPEVRYLRNPVNLGLAGTRNAGLHAATGEIVTFLDADDELHPQKIEFQVRALRPRSVVTCRVRRVGDEVGIANAQSFGLRVPVEVVRSSRALLYGNRLTGAALMAPRALLLEVGGYDPVLRSCEDLDLWLRLLDAGIVAVDVALPLYLYRLNPMGLSRNLRAISYWEITVLEAYFRRRGGEFLVRSADARVWAFWLLKHMLREAFRPDREFRQEIRGNIARLSAHPVLRGGLHAVDRLRLLSPIASLLGALPWGRRRWGGER